MTPTIEEVNRVAEECGAEEIEITDRNFESPEPAYFVRSFTFEQLHAFAQHWIEVGRKEQRDIDAAIADKFGCGYCGMDGVIGKAIRDNTGE